MNCDYGSVRVRPALLSDAEALAPKLRAADIQEIAAGTALPPAESLKRSVEVSSKVFALELASGEVVALFGVAPTDEPKLGSVWLMGSERIREIRYVFLRHSKEWLAHLAGTYPLLGNFVDARNTLHIDWLRWLGFRFLRRARIGRNGEEFIEFVWLRE